ncbi:MAG: hypothetical protein CMJ85_12845 [Planctomycetes bacterium]|jgi:UDP-N-acetylmuramyl pentapeptide phosphotransferase/UDP-N-acetylglucosamine-1-phosphate transferase|nr:hypothetical protein [Planctomycetota bacterium]
MSLGGGIAVAIVVLAGLAFTDTSVPILAGLATAFAVGLIDDARKAQHGGLRWQWKLAGQFLAAAFVLFERPEASAVLWLVVCMNAWNFLDNTDGVLLGTGLGALVPVALLCGHIPSLVVATTLLAFTPFQWPRARIYFGDSGSHTIGFAIGWFAIDLFPTVGPAAFMALHFVAHADMWQVVAVRVIQGIPPWRGDRRHLAHRLQRWILVPAIGPIFLAAQAAIAVLVLLVLTTRQ